MEKINLGKMVNDFQAREKAEKYKLAVEHVETCIIPHLTFLAERGMRFTVITPPPNVLLQDVCQILTDRVTCKVEPSGFRGRIRISW